MNCDDKKSASGIFSALGFFMKRFIIILSAILLFYLGGYGNKMEEFRKLALQRTAFKTQVYEERRSLLAKIDAANRELSTPLQAAEGPVIDLFGLMSKTLNKNNREERLKQAVWDYTIRLEALGKSFHEVLTKQWEAWPLRKSK